MKTIRSLPSTAPVIGRADGNGATLSAEQHPENPTTFGHFVAEQVAHGQKYRYEIQVQVEEQGQLVLRLGPLPPFVRIVNATGNPL